MNEESKVENMDLSSQEGKVEILDFDEVDNPLETRKENRITFIIIGVVLGFLTLLPTISGLFNSNTPIIKNTVSSDIEYTDVADGFLVIGSSEGSITAKNVQFYNFEKRTGNKITFNYMPENNISNPSSLNIYIELYNNKKATIYRKKFDVSSLERKVISTYDLSLNENIYGESVYAKIAILNEEDFKTIKEEMTCELNVNVDNLTVVNKIIYTFSENGLVNYKVNKVVNNLSEEVSENYFESEYKKLTKYEISDLVSENNAISYTIDLLDSKFSDYKSLYTLGSTIREVKLDSESKGWRCE